MKSWQPTFWNFQEGSMLTKILNRSHGIIVQTKAEAQACLKTLLSADNLLINCRSRQGLRDKSLYSSHGFHGVHECFTQSSN